MTAFGKYDPTNTQHASSLFTYGEVPLASLKLNLWNGNVAAAVDFLVEAAVTLFGGWEADYVLPGLSSAPLAVTAREVPELTVSVNAGRCIVAKYFAGIDAAEVVPAAGAFTPPAAEDRIDLVVIERSGNVVVVTGAEGTPPEAPAAPGETLKLAEVYLRPGAACIKNQDDGVNGYLIDRRPGLLSGRAHRHGEDREPGETPDGVRVSFTTGSVFVSGTLRVHLNGVLQRGGAGADYTEDAGRHGYTFGAAPKTGDAVQHFYLEE